MGKILYDRQFKLQAVKLVLEDNMTIAETARQYGIHYNTLYHWVSEYEVYGDEAFPNR